MPSSLEANSSLISSGSKTGPSTFCTSSWSDSAPWLNWPSTSSAWKIGSLLPWANFVGKRGSSAQSARLCVDYFGRNADLRSKSVVESGYMSRNSYTISHPLEDSMMISHIISACRLPCSYLGNLTTFRMMVSALPHFIMSDTQFSKGGNIELMGKARNRTSSVAANAAHFRVNDELEWVDTRSSSPK